MPERYEYPATEFDEPKKKTGAASRHRYFPLLLAISAFVALADHLSKKFIVHHLPTGRAHTVIPGLLRITHVLNTGAAFSFLADSASPDLVLKGLILFSAAAVIIVGVLLLRSCDSLSLTSIALALILGGAIGNLYDRIVYHYVIDFIEVHIFHYHWPDFNFADSAIVIGACLLMIEIFRPQPEADASA
ncbi:signal peptidase II [Edaphobacter flagellatus]|uniref:signal peptidase II n=1 Tax=Edaphobacter flagellatus TaxID=1933044 RepID=UPI0021B3AD7D|nr:signal peptidase II [Edaphobacter flagellatus]